MPEQDKQPFVSVNDYRPRSMLRVKKTEVLQARFPVIDAHNHYNDGFNLDQVIANMDACNVRVFCDLSGMNGDHLKRRLELLKGKYPDRFAVFYVPDFKRINEPDFGEREARALEEAVSMGVQAVKIFKSLGLYARNTDGSFVRVNDSRFNPFWQAAGELGLPVLIHVADPFAFFEPLNERNERYFELSRHPDWHFYGDFPPLKQILEDRDALLESFPNTKWIGAHIGSESEDLDRASLLLERYPNYFVDFSAREAEIGRQPRRAREFFLRFQDRILFGTDCPPEKEVYRSYFRTLETDDEYYEYYGWPGQGLWRIYGLHLPDDVLRKVYYENAMKLIPGVRV